MLISILSTLETDADRDFTLAIYNDHQKSMAAIIYQVTHDSQSIGDIIQTTIIKLIPHIDKLQAYHPAQVRKYALLTAKSAAIDYQRKQMRDKRWSCYADDLAEQPSPKVTPEQKYINQESRDELLAAVEELSEREHDLICYKYFLDCSDKQLAELFGITTVNVRQRLHRARKHLEELVLGRWGGNEKR